MLKHVAYYKYKRLVFLSPCNVREMALLQRMVLGPKSWPKIFFLSVLYSPCYSSRILGSYDNLKRKCKRRTARRAINWKWPFAWGSCDFSKRTDFIVFKLLIVLFVNTLVMFFLWSIVLIQVWTLSNVRYIFFMII